MSGYGESILPGQELELSRKGGLQPHSELVGDAASVRAALERGYEIKAPVMSRLGEGFFYRGLKQFGSLIIREGKEYGDVEIRQIHVGEDAATLLQTVNNEYSNASQNKLIRATHPNNVANALENHRSDQLESGKRNFIQTVGSAGVLGGLPFINNLLQIIPYQTDPLLLLAAASGSVVLGVCKAISQGIQLRDEHQAHLRNLAYPEVPANARELFQWLTPLLDEVAVALDSAPLPGDITVSNRAIVINFKNVAKMLKRAGGPDFEDYKEILSDLRDTAKRIGYESNPQTHSIKPAEVIKDMLVKSEGELWSEEFAERIRALSAAQASLKQNEKALKNLSATIRDAPGIDGKAKKSILNKNKAKLEDTVELCMLQIFKLNALHNEAKAAHTVTEVADPYVIPDILEEELKSEGVEPENPDSTPQNLGWLVMQNGKPISNEPVQDTAQIEMK